MVGTLNSETFKHEQSLIHLLQKKKVHTHKMQLYEHSISISTKILRTNQILINEHHNMFTETRMKK